MAMRPIMGMTKSAVIINTSFTSRSAVQLTKSRQAKAITPKEPTRLSFMISSTRSRSRPEKTPSTVSIKPSSIKPPVSRMGRIISNVVTKFAQPNTAIRHQAASI